VNSKPKKIIILTTNPFPNGLAGTNRILAYCKGFIYHGYLPEVICLRPTEAYDNVFNPLSKGIYNKIKFIYSGGTSIRVNSFWRRRKNDFIANFTAFKLLIKFVKSGNVKFIIFYGNSLAVELCFILIAKLHKIKILKEESENPEIYFRGRYNIFKKWFVVNWLYRYYNCVLVMTNPLKNYFLSKGIPSKRILHIPQTIDLERFKKANCNSIIPFPNDYIAYVGSLNQQKDGVLTLIESFKVVLEKHPKINLIIAGEGTPQEKDELLARIRNFKLEDKVFYSGRMASNEIPAFLGNAKLLASCRPKSIQSDYGFPTKVLEYLASGKPTVTTTTGELVLFLKDRENAYVADSADAKTFGLKIIELLDDYDLAMKVAKKGIELVKQKFDLVVHTNIIIDFCKQ